MPELPEHVIGIENALRLATEDSIVEFLHDTIRLHTIVETGETELRHLRAGNAEYIANVPTREPLLSGAIPFELDKTDFDPPINSIKWGDNPSYTISHPLPADPEVAEWRAVQLDVQEVVDAAQLIVEKRAEGGPETTNCMNCQGEKTFHLDCNDCSGGVSKQSIIYMDLENKGDSTELSEYGGICNNCNGTGSYDNPCPRCNGSGNMDLHPTLKLVNQTSKESLEVTLNVPYLIANGLMKVIRAGYENNEYNYAKGETRLFLDLNSYTRDQFAKIGIDTDRSSMVSKSGRIFDSWQSNPWTNAQWIVKKKQDSSYTSGTYGNLQNAHDTVLEFEKLVVANFIEESRTTLTMTPRRSLASTLIELRTLLEGRDFRLGLGIGFVATEEYGPEVYVMDHSGNIAGSLGADYSAQTAMESAIMQIKK